MLVNKVIVAVFAAGSLVSVLSAQGTTTRVSVSSQGGEARCDDVPCVISADGRFVGFESASTSLLPGLPNSGPSRFYLHDRQTAVTALVCVRPDGYIGLGSTYQVAISGDGNVAAFQYLNADLDPLDTNNRDDIYVRDFAANTLERVSLSSTGVQVNAWCGRPKLSHDGRFVVFESYADNLVPNDTNGSGDIFIKDRLTSVLTRISVSNAGAEAAGHSERASISASGSVVAFESNASNLVSQNIGPSPFIFVRDIAAGTTTWSTPSSIGQVPNGSSDSPAISGDGRYIAFVGRASNLVVNDTNGVADIFVHDRQTLATTRVSVSSLGVQTNGDCERPSISADGGLVSFLSVGSNLTPGDTWGFRDVFVRSRSQSTTVRVSVDSFGNQANNSTSHVAIAADGEHVAMISVAGNLVPNDFNGATDAFVHSFGCPLPSTYCTAGTTTGGCVPWISGTGVPSVSAGSGFDIVVNEVDGQRFGLIYYGFAPASASWGIGSTSYICVAPPTQRTLITGTGGTNGACDGSQILDINAYMAANPGSLGSPFTNGQVIYAQGWFRDPGAAKQTNLSDGLRFTLCD